MSDAWIVVIVVGIFTVLFKAAGPVFLGRRQLPARVDAVAAGYVTDLFDSVEPLGDEQL